MHLVVPSQAKCSRRLPVPEPSYRIGADVGGTFTDLVLLGTDGLIARRKLHSTPADYGVAIVTGIDDLLRETGVPRGAIAGVVHGTTVATNAILEGRGARTGLITTRGFRDVLELRRVRIPELYNFLYEAPAPLVPRHLRLEVAERIGPRGEIRLPLDRRSAEQAMRRLRESGIEALAICLLHSYGNPVHERRLAALARRMLPESVFVSCSSDILREIREYERTSTTVINAYLGPMVERYMSALISGLRGLGIQAPLQVMQSSGGIMGVEGVLQKPAYIVESGPAAGVIGGATLAELCGYKNVITIDMGGTTAKASMVEGGQVTKTSEYEVGAGINLSSQLVKGRGHALKLPVLDISEIGAGGGSLAAVDASGVLTVGPQSAGAVPGPVCYGLGGTVPTLTDAVVTLGYLNPRYLVGGAVRLDAEKARAALGAQVARPLGLGLLEAAYGVFRIAATTMSWAVKAVSTFRGRDPREFRLLAFGGNGPLIATQIASALGMREVIVPPMPGVFSAFGLLVARREREFSQALFHRTSGLAPRLVDDAFTRLEAGARAALAREGCAPDGIEIHRFADLRYSGQAYELTVPVPPGSFRRFGAGGLVETFSREHERTYGHSATNEPVDLISLRVVASERADGTAALIARVLAAASQPVTGRHTRRAFFGPGHGELDTPVLDRRALGGHTHPGPVIIEEYDATCVVPPGWSAALDPSGNIRLTAPA
ncbi:MAG: hydantoinase/oxoprolinase family protein [Candidatus Rokubacteria bacterium]|nr:hydantoinase/oxoprolinase family protein [Candidatus Rokubacteria bacterium]